jgi:hypothetical protein
LADTVVELQLDCKSNQTWRGSLAKIYGVITFILEHPERIAAYLRDQERLWEELKQESRNCAF